MYKKFSLLFGPFLAIVLLVTLTGYAQIAFASPASAESLVMVKKISVAEQQAALAFWTDEMVAKAKPMEILVDYDTSNAGVSPFGTEMFAFEGQFSPPGKADANANDIARRTFTTAWTSNSGSFAGSDIPVDELTGASQVFTSYVVNGWAAAQKIYPHKWIGRLSFNTPSGTAYCSATAISGNNIVTAAHCVYDTTNNRWYSGWVFRPAYRNGNSPYGQFAATYCAVLTAWVNLSGSFSINSWTRYDVAVCKMGKNGAGQTLNQAVGYAGRQWNYGYVRHFFNLGYPFRNTSLNLLPNAGKYLRTCVAESFNRTTDTLGMGCNFASGISGGPWLIGYAPPAASGYVNSVNSGILVGTQNIYGPRFNSNNIVPLCNAMGC